MRLQQRGCAAQARKGSCAWPCQQGMRTRAHACGCTAEPGSVERAPGWQASGAPHAGAGRGRERKHDSGRGGIR
eukprot:15461795-Alexandrium_andersonii.AAC.1